MFSGLSQKVAGGADKLQKGAAAELRSGISSTSSQISHTGDAIGRTAVTTATTGAQEIHRDVTSSVEHKAQDVLNRVPK